MPWSDFCETSAPILLYLFIAAKVIFAEFCKVVCFAVIRWQISGNQRRRNQRKRMNWYDWYRTLPNYFVQLSSILVFSRFYQPDKRLQQAQARLHEGGKRGKKQSVILLAIHAEILNTS